MGADSNGAIRGLLGPLFHLGFAKEDLPPDDRGEMKQMTAPRPTGMTDDTARRQLKRMMRSFTPGSILHLLSENFEEMAEEARSGGDEIRLEQYVSVARTLFVVGLGIDAACPR